jgi:hypothetical protein
VGPSGSNRRWSRPLPRSSGHLCPSNQRPSEHDLPVPRLARTEGPSNNVEALSFPSISTSRTSRSYAHRTENRHRSLTSVSAAFDRCLANSTERGRKASGPDERQQIRVDRLGVDNRHAV